MKLIKALTSLVPLVMLVGCGNPADKVPAAAVGPASNAAAKATEPSDSGSGGSYFAFGPSSSTIEFVGSKVTGSHNGGFRNFAGEFQVVNGKLAGTGNKVLIDASSLWSDNDRLTGHLKNPDFFDVARFPTATFVTESISEGKTNSTVTGNLTLHGVTKKISFPATVQIAKDAVNVTAEFFINRFDFDIKYEGRSNDLVRKEVVLKLNVKAVPGRADFAAVEKAAQAGAATAQAEPQPGGPRRRAGQ